ncbi:sodium/calcium exchanger regulatory protein 1-like [Pecten maximus]|uniref:sodium/calcium exchanger regulatory protein 1-like n=1 Tax=Pecten maximus TaxID=6579 RepID=UPI0014590243|nr:sodium/calcium exchanger regulatory protein 1-like [Pecten maximus]
MEETGHIAGGTWKLVRSENFEQYCKCLGVPFFKRWLSALIYPCQKICVTRGRWSILTSSFVKQTDVQLTVGQDCTWPTFDGRMIRTSVILENGRLVLRQLDPPFAKITREFDEETMIMTLEVTDVKARRIYKRQETPTTDLTNGQVSGWSRTLLFVSLCFSTISIAWYWKMAPPPWA